MDASAFQALKLAIVETSGLSRDALHVHAGLAGLLLAALVTRRALGNWLPLTIVAAVALAVEAADLVEHATGTGRWRWAASVHDLVNTLLWPTALLLLARTGLGARLFRRGR